MSLLLALLVTVSVQQGEVISRLFAATSEGPFITYSWGEHWQRLRGDTRGFTGSIDAFVCLGPLVFAGGADGLFVSDDYGETYRKVDTFPGDGVTTLLSARLFAFEPTLFVGTSSGLYRSTDGGGKWQRVGGDALRSTVHALAWPGPELFAATERGVYLSRDGGEQWERLGRGLPDGGLLALSLSRFFALDPTVFVGTRGAGLYRSRDGGERFEPVGAAEIGDASTVHELFWWGSLLLVGTDRGLYLSDDAGESFQPVAEIENIPVYAIAVPAAETEGPSDVLVGTARGVFKSSDGARSFRLVTEGLGRPEVTDLATFPVSPPLRERGRSP